MSGAAEQPRVRWAPMRPVRLSPAATDVVVVAVVAFPTVMDAWWNEDGTSAADGWTYAVAIVSLAALLVRRRWPLIVALVCGAGLTVWYVRGHHGELLNLPTLVALYTVAVQGTRARTLAVGAIAVAWSGLLGFTSDDPAGARGGSPILEMITPTVPLAFGEATRTRRQLLAEHAARAARAEADRDRDAAHRVALERVRIARDLHDVVAHTLAAVNVQMSVAVAAFDTSPETARAAIDEARAASRAALDELRQSVAALRERDGDLPASPSIASLDDLAATARAASIRVEIDDRRRGPLPAAIDLAVARVVQESLTNVVRHAGARSVWVTITETDDVVAVSVCDDGVGPPAEGARGGLGLVGLRERVESAGGRFEAGAGEGGGFRVRAELPRGRW